MSNLVSVMQGDSGTVFSFTVKDQGKSVNITGSNVEVVIKRRAERIIKSALITDGENGKCEMVLNSNDTSETGVHTFQATVKFSDGREFSSDVLRFTVEKKL